jgi:hypothetical protein
MNGGYFIIFFKNVKKKQTPDYRPQTQDKRGKLLVLPEAATRKP